MKKVSACLLALTLCFISSFTSFAEGGIAGGKPADIVAVIDDTISMQTNDPMKLAAVAVDQLADKLLPNENIKLGMATYSLNVGDNHLDLGSYTVDEIKAFASTINQRGSGTDAAAGLKWAVDQLDAYKDDGAEHAVIILGDGANDFVGKRDPAESDAMYAEAMDKAKSNGYKIYSLAINPESKKFSDYFEGLAAETGGIFKKPTSETINADIEEIVNSITKITVKNNGSEDLEPGETISTPYDVEENTFQINARINHKDSLDIKITDPDGNTISADNENNILTQSDSYSNFKVIRPKAGTWTVSLTNTSPNTQPVDWQITTMADISMVSDLTKENDDYYITSKLMLEGSPITDKAALSQINGVVKVREDGSSEETVYDSVLDDTSFRTKLILDDNKRYNIRVLMDISGASIEKTFVYPDDFPDIAPSGASDTSTPEPAGNAPAEKDSNILPIILIIVCAALLLAVAAVIASKVLKNKKDNAHVLFDSNLRVRLIHNGSHGRDTFNERLYTNIRTVFLSEDISTMETIMDKYRSMERSIIGDMASGMDKIERTFTPAFSEAVSKIKFYGIRKGTEYIEFTQPVQDEWVSVEFFINEMKISNYPYTMPVNTDNEYEIVIKLGNEDVYTIEVSVERPF